MTIFIGPSVPFHKIMSESWSEGNLSTLTVSFDNYLEADDISQSDMEGVTGDYWESFADETVEENIDLTEFIKCLLN